MFLRQFRETRRPPSPRTLLESRLPWGSFPDAEQRVMRTNDDGYFVGFQLEAPDLESLPSVDVAFIMHRLNEAFKRLPESWGGWMETRRASDPPLTPGRFPDAVSQYVEEEHCAGLNARGLLGTRTYLFVWQRPVSEEVSKLSQFLFTPAERPFVDRARRAFDAGLRTWLGLLVGGCILTPLTGSDFLTVLYEPLLSPARRIHVPVPPTRLNTLAEVGLWPALDPMIGPHPRQREYLGCLSLDREFPPELMMGLWRDLWRVPHPFRCMWRWMPRDRGLARQSLDNEQDNIETSRLRAADLVWSVLKRDQQVREDAHVDRQKTQVDHTRDLMLSDEFALGDLTTTLVMQHADLNTLDAMLLDLAKPIHAAGCTVKRETYNTTEAFFSTLAGLPYVNSRALQMTSLNLACIGPFHTPYQGPRSTPHLGGPVLTHGITSTCMLARVSSHDEDCADTLVIGPKGSGKSSFMAFADVCQWLRYPEARVMAWSAGGSFRCVATCLGGEHYNLYRDPLQIQILRDLDDVHEVPWILTWLLNRCRDRQMVMTSLVPTILTANLERLRQSRAPRRLSALIDCLEDHRHHVEPLARVKSDAELWKIVHTIGDLVNILRDFCQGGIYGTYVDAPEDRFNLHRIVSLDPDEVLNLPGVYPALLEIIFHRARQRRDGAPTRYVFDEAHHMLDTPTFVDFLAQDIPDWRRENSSGCFGTQALAQLTGTKITSLLFESSVVRYYLPNSHAMEGASRDAYEAMGLHPDEIQAHLVEATPKREVYMVRSDGRRRIDLRLFPVAQAICGASSLPAHRLMDAVEREYEPERFAVGWLRACGHDDAARTIDRALERTGTHAGEAALLDAMVAAD